MIPRLMLLILLLLIAPIPLRAQREIDLITANSDWEPIIQVFDGVEMVLVPSGCFMMGSTSEQIDILIETCKARRSNAAGCDWYQNEGPQHEICFDEPFWIDRYEVTNETYGSAACTAFSSEPNQPHICVGWFEARDFCKNRGDGVRLPTEAEWEYAARGPDGLIFPWGNEFVQDYVVYEDNPEYGKTTTAPVGSHPDGASWVGALDMSGNAIEWISSIYEDYPYDSTDGREDMEDDESVRVLRGGDSLWSSTVTSLRTTSRRRSSPFMEYGDFDGFRCVRDYQSDDLNATNGD